MQRFTDRRRRSKVAFARLVLRALAALCAASACTTARGGSGGFAGGTHAGGGFAPGARSLLDAHNAYPEQGRWGDRIERALATGLPLAIEQDLFWRVGADGHGESVVAHDTIDLGGAPTLQAHFFERIKPLMKRALRDGGSESWPLVVLNLDFKDSVPAHHERVLALLSQYDEWLTVAPRSATPERVEPLTVGPLLVLTGSAPSQRRRFHDAVPVGGRIRLFGAMAPAPIAGDSAPARLRRAMAMTPAEHVPRDADNYARWVNFPWSVVEAGGQRAAGAWTAADSLRLAGLVGEAHRRGFWIRFYTLDGFSSTENHGFTASYNFGSLERARPRWRAAMGTGVDFIATDQYEAFAAERVRQER